MRSRLPLLALALMSLAGCAATSSTMISGKTGSADPETVAGDYLQGRFAASQQRFGDASDAFSRAIAETGDAGVKQSAFRYALVAGDFTRARAYAEEILSAPPVIEEGGHDQVQLAGFLDDDLPRLTLIADAFRGQNYIAAQAALKDPFASGLGTAMGDLLEAWAIYPDTGLEAATEKLAETQESNFAGFTPFHLALMFDLEDRTEGAEVAYAQALRAPGADMAVRAYAGFVERNKSKEEAIDLFQRLSEDRGYLRRVGRLGLSRLGEPLAGETAEFRRVAAKAPLRMVSSAEEGAALVFLNFAWTAYERAMTQRDAALEAGFGEIPLNLEVPLTLAQLAVAIDPDLDGGHYIIGSIATYYERYDDAARAQGRVKPVSWLYNYAAIAQAEAYVAMDRRNEGINLIKDYLKQDALAPDVTLELANLLAQEGRIDEAYKAGSEAIAIAEQLSSEENRGSNLWRYYFARGAITAEAGDWARAEPDLRQSLELSPDEPGLLNYLGYSYVERGENIDEAFGMIERALEARPTSGAITDSLGWAYYQRGDYKMAVEYLERAVQLEPGDDVITDHLGDAYWQAGRKSEARYEWRRVLEIEGLGEELKQRVEAKLNGEPPAPGSLADMADSE
ncbi:tetratricopeptide repeat protein [Parvularcula marina]|uniref:tetratricopeptide repeat protein n=1 Tax=Parvularcula marina TaxID=2292771 RepID=UPI003511536F